MPHRAHTRNLGRHGSWRKATVKSLAQGLLRSERIVTTRARAKETQRLVERLVTLGKRGTLAARRRSVSLLGSPQLVRRLFVELAPRMQNRAGGYTRIVLNGHRWGDGASLAVLELVDREAQAKPISKEKEGKALPPRPAKPQPKGRETPPSGEVSRDKGLEVKKPKDAEPKEEKPTRGESKVEKPKGFLEGLRSIFHRRKGENPS